MAELSKCPNCGGEAEHDCYHGDFFIQCMDTEVCGFNGSNHSMVSEAAAAWNLLCEQIRVGKEIMAALEEDQRLNYELGIDNQGTYLRVYTTFESAPVPTVKDVLRECGEVLDEAIRVSNLDWQDKLTPLKAKIVAALAAEENPNDPH